ncbi:DUF2652 domain-containing protein [candidate division KSB1 bacterium]|nr:MAG: DUF2652 domain-containing protein [candidate division KSB1 bacterium]MCE7945434.1 DUF2652 domain-containing protein [Chlorobi bacterium CHB1]
MANTSFSSLTSGWRWLILRNINHINHEGDLQPPTSQAVLLIADISGFTQFMKLHRMATNHAKQIVVKLLRAIISVSAPPLKLAELEGDAAFFYAVCPEGNVPRTLAAIKTQLPAFFQAFYQALHQTCDLRLCVCEACTKVEDMRLKIVLHAGEVAIERIQTFEKLFGLDVILVHRLLKNPLSAREYILMTDPIFRQFGDFYELRPEKCKVNCEGIGKVETHVFYPPAELSGAAGNRTEKPSASFLQKLRWTAKLDGKFFLELLGLHKQKAPA